MVHGTHVKVEMQIHPQAGKPADPQLLVNVPRLVSAYYTGMPDAHEPAQRLDSKVVTG